MKKEHGGNVYKISRETGMDITDIIDFSANINPLGIPESGKDAIINGISGLVNYPDPEYIEFRKAVGKHHDIDYRRIVPGNGAIDSLFAAVAAVRPNKVLVSVPSFVEYEKAVEKAGAEYIPSYRLEENGYGFNTGRFIDDISEEIDLAVLCNPNNPTGDLVSFDDIVLILEKCRKTKTYLLLDEAFMEFAEHFGARSAVELIPSYPELIVSRSLTKYFAVPGLRAGYLVVGSGEVRDRLLDTAEPWKLNYLADKFCQQVLVDKVYSLQTENWILAENEKLYIALNEIEHLSASRSYANYIFLKYIGEANLKEALLGKGIMIRSCDNYDGIGQSYYRVAVKDSDSNKKLIDALTEICK